jgi:hypothetical protein
MVGAKGRSQSSLTGSATHPPTFHGATSGSAERAGLVSTSITQARSAVPFIRMALSTGAAQSSRQEAG